MDGASMLYNFRIGLDVIASNAAPGFTDIEIYSLLNKAEDYLVLESHKNKQWDNIFSLITEISGISGGSDRQYIITIPNDYWFPIDSYSIINRHDAGYNTSFNFISTGFIPDTTINFTGRIVKNIPISVEDGYKLLQTGFCESKTYKNPYYWLEGLYCNIITDYYTTMTSGKLKYIKKRIIIDGSNNSQLPESMHRIIVDQAIKFAQESILSQLPNKQ